MYGVQPDIIFDGSNPVSRRVFAEKNGLCNKGLSSKRLKIAHNCIELEVEKMFGPLEDKNLYKYNFIDNEELIQKVERMWMNIHQKTMVPSSRFINCSEARGFMVQEKGKDVNWHVLVEWTIRNRLWRKEREFTPAKSQGTIVETMNLEDDQENGDDTNIYFKMAHPNCRSDEVQVQVVGELLSYLVALEKEIQAFKLSVKALKATMDHCDVEFTKVET
jgi:hypothetical protein